MRRQPTELRSQGTRIRSRDESRGAMAKRSRLRRLTLESLEAADAAGDDADAGRLEPGDGLVVLRRATRSTTAARSIAVDPLNPRTSWWPSSRTGTRRAARRSTSSRVTFSTDGGADLELRGAASRSSRATRRRRPGRCCRTRPRGSASTGTTTSTSASSRPTAATPATWSSTSTTSPAASPVAGQSSGSWCNSAVYSWDQAVTGANLQPTVLNFSMAVDANVSSYADPTTGATAGRPELGRRLHRLDAQHAAAAGRRRSGIPYTIQVIASSDGVTWPASGLTGDTGNGTALVSQGNFNGTPRYTAPQIAVSQGKANGTDGGQHLGHLGRLRARATTPTRRSTCSTTPAELRAQRGQGRSS